jgi:site-specific DNA-methyltransferase (adenine-specific)
MNTNSGEVISTIRNSWKPNHTIYKDGRRFPLSVLNFPAVIDKTKGQRIKHPTQKPIEILEWIVKSSSKREDIVLDCFMGSGTTAIACMRLNRNFLGCEINNDYFKSAQARIEKEKSLF